MKKKLFSLVVALTLAITASISVTTQVSAETIAGTKQLYHLAVEDQLFGSYDWGGAGGIAFPSNSMAVAYPAMYAPKVKNDLYNGGGWNSSGNIIRVKNYISVKSLGDVYMDATNIYGGRDESRFARKVQLWKISGILDNNNNSQITAAMATTSNWAKVAEVTILPDRTEALGVGAGLNWTNLATPVSLKPNEVYVVLTEQGAGADVGVWGNPRPNEINNVLAVHPDNMSGANKEIASYSDFAAGGATIGIFDGDPVAYVNGVMGTMYSGANFRYDVVPPPDGNTAKQLYHLAIEDQLFDSYDWGGTEGVAFPANSMAANYSWGAKTKADLYNGGGFSSSGNVVRVVKDSYIMSLGDVYMDATTTLGGRDESRFARGVQLWKISGVTDNTNDAQINSALSDLGNWSKVTEVTIIPNKTAALTTGKGFNWIDLPAPVMVRVNEVYVIVVEQGAGATYGVWGNPRPNEINNVLAIHPDNLNGGPAQISNLNDFVVSGATIGIYNGSPIPYGYGVMGQMYSGGNLKYDYTTTVSFGTFVASSVTNTLTKVNPGTSILTALEQITQSPKTEIKDRDNALVTNYTLNLGTGMKVEITTLDGTAAYTVIIKGDVSGDGLIGIADLASIKSHLLSMQTLTGAFLTAGDFNATQKVTISSLLTVKKHELGIALITQ